jgi:hypothetical protein
MYLGGIIDGVLSGKNWDQIVQNVEAAKKDLKDAIGWDLGAFNEDLGNFILAAFTIATFGAGSSVSASGNMTMTILKTVVAPALLETGVQLLADTIKGSDINAANIALGLILNLLPGAFDLPVSTNKIVAKVFKGADEIIDGAGNVITKSEFEKFLLFAENGIDDLPWGKFTNILENYSDDLAKLSAKELKYLTELSDYAGKLDEAILKNINIPSGTKIADLDPKLIDNAIDLADSGVVVDFSKIANYGDDIIKHGDDIYTKLDGVMTHIDDLDNIDDVVRKMELSGYQFPCIAIASSSNFLTKIKNVFIPKVSAAGGCVSVISEGWTKIGDDFYKIGKSTNYRDGLKKVYDSLPNDIKEAYKLDFPGFPSGFDANHRLPPNILKDSPKGLTDLLNQLEVKNINDPRLMEFMDPSINQKLHRDLWTNLVNGRKNLTANEILDIWKQVELNEGVKYIFRPDTAIDIF